MTTVTQDEGNRVEYRPLTTGDTYPEITYTPPPDFPLKALAGVTLRGGQVLTHPTAGKGVRFLRTQNEAAFKKAGIKDKELFIRLEGRPALQALAAEAAAHNARRAAEAQAKLDEERRQCKILLDKMRAEEADLVRRIPPDHVRVTVREVGSADGDPIYEYEADGTKLTWNAPGMVHYGTPYAMWPGALSSFASAPVYSIPRAELEKIRAEKRRQADEANAKARAEAERRQAAFSQARQTGKPVELSRHSETVDDPENENSLDIVVRWAMPDGTVRVQRTPTH